jgi:enoyl-CoA hydratase/carnithine racemase
VPDAPRGDLDQRYSYLLGIPKPIIAAINGPAVGVGLCLALYADLRYIAETAKVSAAFARRGLIAEHGSSWLLPRLIGVMNAMDLLLTGKSISAARAAEIGLAYLLPDGGFHDKVREIAVELATWSSPRSMSIIKSQVIEDLNKTLGDSVVRSDIEQFTCIGSTDLKEGIASFLEKRKPHFSGISSSTKN